MMLFTKKNWILFAFLAVALACQSKQELTSNQQAKVEIPDQEGWNAVLTSTSEGKITSKIKYTHMQRFSNKRVTQFDQGVEIELYDEKGILSSIVFAEKAELIEVSKHIKLSENVRVQSLNGFLLTTSRLQWNEITNMIMSDEFVTVVTAENDTINGVGFESDKALHNWVIKNPHGVTKQKLNLNIDDDASTK
ncbi:MAG: LPS export ABC transporter periplasmic protein LptC [bacterium]